VLIMCSLRRMAGGDRARSCTCKYRPLHINRGAAGVTMLAVVRGPQLQSFSISSCSKTGCSFIASKTSPCSGSSIQRRVENEIEVEGSEKERSEVQNRQRTRPRICVHFPSHRTAKCSQRRLFSKPSPFEIQSYLPPII